jgi:hypothetical protein
LPMFPLRLFVPLAAEAVKSFARVALKPPAYAALRLR